MPRQGNMADYFEHCSSQAHKRFKTAEQASAMWGKLVSPTDILRHELGERRGTRPA